MEQEQKFYTDRNNEELNTQEGKIQTHVPKTQRDRSSQLKALEVVDLGALLRGSWKFDYLVYICFAGLALCSPWRSLGNAMIAFKVQ